MDVPTAGLPIACKPYLIPLKYHKLVDEGISLLENAGCILTSLGPWAAPPLIVPKKLDPLNSQKQQFCLALNYQPLNRSINVANNGNSLISTLYPT